MSLHLYRVELEVIRQTSIYVVAESSDAAEQIAGSPIIDLLQGAKEIRLASHSYGREVDIPPEVLEELAFSPDGRVLGIIGALQDRDWQIDDVESLDDPVADLEAPPVKLDLYRVSLTLEASGRMKVYETYVAAQDFADAQEILFQVPSLGSAIDLLEDDPSTSLASLSITVWAREAIPKRALKKNLYSTDGDALGTVGEWLEELR